MIRLALYQPDIPTNTGTILRLAACLDTAVDIIEPCGFPFSDKALKRAGMDYLAQVDLTRHIDWTQFLADVRAKGRRLVLIETGGASAYTDFGFQPSDTLLLGRETAGSPPEVWAAADAVTTIPMRQSVRSLNVAVAAAMALGEALRQTNSFPIETSDQN
jgi:tRNA (cytidine/uridine-2'-O-)-methyltransferase